MKFNKPLAIALTATAVGAAGLLGAGAAFAAQSSDHADPMGSLVDAIATKFNLDRSAVQQVVDDQHAAMEQQHQQQFADRLKQAVADGTLTQDQADKLTAKQAEVQAFLDSLKNKAEDERRTAMKTEFDSLRTWAQDNGIPGGFLPFGPRGMHGHGPHGSTDDGQQLPAPAPSA